MLDRLPPTPSSRLLGICLLLAACVTDGLAMYFLGWGRFWRAIVYLLWTVLLIYLGLEELFFGDGWFSVVLSAVFAGS